MAHRLSWYPDGFFSAEVYLSFRVICHKGVTVVPRRHKNAPWWRTPLWISILSLAIIYGFPFAFARDGAPGITMPTTFLPFNPNERACSPPSNLRRALAYVQENRREFLEGVDHGLSLAAKNRGLEYFKIVVDNDVAKAVDQIRLLRALGVGSLVATSSDPTAISKSLQEAIWSGVFVGTIVPPPATLLLNAPQFATGKALTDAATIYINAALGGRARVVLLTQDTMEYLSPRFEAMREGLNKLPGVEIVADIAPKPVSIEGGFETMKTILLANPDIDVVLGGDAVVLGALKALRAAGKARPNQFLGGIDGEPNALSEIKKGDSPYKASVALASPVFGYAMGQFAADWLMGKSIPQAMDILPIALTKKTLAQYQADLTDPASVFSDLVRRDSYLKMYGNICYDTRDQYVNFPWSSEQK